MALLVLLISFILISIMPALIYIFSKRNFLNILLYCVFVSLVPSPDLASSHIRHLLYITLNDITNVKNVVGKMGLERVATILIQ
jgi:hypothetical protein